MNYTKVGLERWLLLSVLAFAASAADSDSRIIGRWRSLETSKGGIGAMYDFRANGVVEYSPGAIVEMNYRLDGNQFAFRPSNDEAAEQKQPIKWMSGNKLRIGSGDQAFELTRGGGETDSSNPLVGEWSGTKDMGGRKVDTHWFFYPAGKGLFLIPFLIQQGRYSVKESTIRIELANAEPIESRFQVNGDVLTISKTGENSESRFARY